MKHERITFKIKLNMYFTTPYKCIDPLQSNYQYISSPQDKIVAAYVLKTTEVSTFIDAVKMLQNNSTVLLHHLTLSRPRRWVYFT